MDRTESIAAATEHLNCAKECARKHGEILKSGNAAAISANTSKAESHWSAARELLRNSGGFSPAAAAKMARKIYWGSDVG